MTSRPVHSAHEGASRHANKQRLIELNVYSNANQQVLRSQKAPLLNTVAQMTHYSKLWQITEANSNFILTHTYSGESEESDTHTRPDSC